MDFLTTARMLMDLRAKHPDLRYTFEHTRMGTTLTMRLDVAEDVPQMFDDAARMFEPV